MFEAPKAELIKMALAVSTSPVEEEDEEAPPAATDASCY